MTRKNGIVTGLLLATMLGACQERGIVVESNTDWDGYIGGPSNGYSVKGSGNRRFDNLGSGTICWTFQKRTRTGSIRAYLAFPTGIGTSERGAASTSADFGIVSGCS